MKLKITFFLIFFFLFFFNNAFSQKNHNQTIDREFLKNDLSLVFSSIQNEFISWHTKSEFETVSEYNQRILNKENALDSIAYSVLYKFLSDINFIRNFEIQLLKYNAEESKYDVRLSKKGMPYDGFKIEFISINDTIYVEKTIAKQLNERSPLSEIYPNKLKAIPSGTNLGVGSPVDYFPVCFSQWVINEFGFFFPISYKRYFDLYSTLNTELTSLSVYKLNTDELGLKKYFDTNYISKFQLLNDIEILNGLTNFLYKVRENIKGNIYGSKRMLLEIDYHNEEIDTLLLEIDKMIENNNR